MAKSRLSLEKRLELRDILQREHADFKHNNPADGDPLMCLIRTDTQKGQLEMMSFFMEYLGIVPIAFNTDKRDLSKQPISIDPIGAVSIYSPEDTQVLITEFAEMGFLQGLSASV